MASLHNNPEKFLERQNLIFIPIRKIAASLLFILLLALYTNFLFAQQKIFNAVSIPADARAPQGVPGITQDQEGYIWFITKTALCRYDGAQVLIYTHTADTNSVNSAPLESIAVDSNDIIWIGTLGGGLDRFDPATKKFTHFRHNANDPASLAHDTVAAILIDHKNNIWLGTYRGLDKYDRETGKFIHHAYKKNDPHSISSNQVRAIYEDREGTIWAGCGSTLPYEDLPGNGGLNRFDRTTKKFTRYLHDANDPGSIENNKVRAIFEDSKGNFWVGTAGDGLQTLNPHTGVFTHYHYDATHPENLSRGPLPTQAAPKNIDQISFIKEDATGNIWIGTLLEGINKYDPATKKITHYGTILQNGQMSTDTLSGFTDIPGLAWCALNAKDGTLWISTIRGSLYKINPFKNIMLPFTYTHQPAANSFYKDNNGALWIATDAGLVYKPASGKEKVFVHDTHNPNSIISNILSVIRADKSGNLWIGTYNNQNGGIDKFNPVTHTFTHYQHNPKDSSSLGNSIINDLYFEDDNNLWVATNGAGLDKMNISSGIFMHYRHQPGDSNSVSNNDVQRLAVEKNYLWAPTANGLDRLNIKTGKWRHYLPTESVLGLCVDASGILWAGTPAALYHYDDAKDKFIPFENVNAIKIANILNIIEDDEQNLWVSTSNEIYKIDKARKEVKIFSAVNGVHPNTFLFADNFKTKDGELLLGDQLGYYHFFPKDIKDESVAPHINITSLQIGGREILPGEKSILSKPIYKTNEINLSHNQNSFAISFSALHFRTPGEEKYLYMMQNYDNTWHDASAAQKAYFFSLPPGHYILKVRAVNPDGAGAQKNLAIIISPPWYTTWWAIAIFIIILIAIVWAFIYYRSRQLIRENKILEEKVNHRTAQLQQSIEELKSAQKQLVQSEKMASLGELTAGIAHEIQNPLNFVNNFSEVNTELIEELKAERLKQKEDRSEEIEDDIINDIKENSEKIIHHGKRADAIVKSMLQHSRISSGQKEFTDINALADEYFRLSYHGLRAKDKSFNATMNTDFDPLIGRIKVVPQDIGRVLLNLINNAFYSVAEKKKAENKKQNEQASTTFQKLSTLYEPAVSVSTKKLNDKIFIKVKDNGDGIPQKIVDKIYQPFFTTKPTGEGTGLGLSLSYDIIKAHDGEIKVETKEGEGTEFVVMLPA